MSSGNEAIDRILAGFEEDREVEKKVRRHLWAQKSNREKAEALIARVNPEQVYDRDVAVLALAQVHATLALKDN